jgi:hypothetical protein
MWELPGGGWEYWIEVFIAVPVGCKAVQLKDSLAFWRNIPPPFSGFKSKPRKKPAACHLLLLVSCSLTPKMEVIFSLKCWAVSELHGITTQKTIV